MSKTFDQGKDEIARLCRYFATNREAFFAPGVKEAHVRQSLIDPFFEALGWDVRNTARVAPQYREVIPEDSLDIEGQQKAPDYTFRVGTLPKFYVEAKKCGVNIHTDVKPAYQLRRYGWSAKVALSILTDFEELGVYDCTFRPRESDKASRARIQYFRSEEYPDRWRELWDVFSREAVWSGAFDQYAASKRKRGTSEVDVEFLKEIESWRDALARNLALRNKDLSSDDLNAAVQLTIDRVVFLRMAEDRGLESFEQLLGLSQQADVYPNFMKLCRRADEKYNSGLFHFQKESGVSEAPDRITPRLSVDDKVFRPILQSLYFQHGSPYHFGVLPVEILGTVYERFLGKVIRLTPTHQAKIEEKPEVRKAGGVYYTPAYIVEYIVQHTVGRQIEGKSPAQLAGKGKGLGKEPFRVLDMACGSGSFLLGAYQCLLDHCLKWYLDNGPEKFPKAVCAAGENGWRLTIAEKKRILTTHLFGVDIDPQAVEVSKLSLLLKVLEGESDQTVGNTLRLFHERALPNLAENIQCGNSLIGPDYFTGKLIPDAEEMKRVNPFDWAQAFPDVFPRGTGVPPVRDGGVSPRREKEHGQDGRATHGQDAHATAGGFDCIIGNPPYIRIQTMKEWAPLEVEIYKELFRAGRTGNYDIYVVFIEQGLKLLNAKGQLGFICPHKFFNSKYGEPVRGIIAEGQHLAHIVHFGDQQVFEGATTYTCLLFLDKSPAANCRFVKANDLGAWRTTGAGAHGTINANQVTTEEWSFPVGAGAALFERLARMPVKLADVTDRIFQGLKTGGDKVFIVQQVLRQKRRTKVYSHQTESEHWIENELLHPLVKGGDSKAFDLVSTDRLILFPYSVSEGRASLITQRTMKESFPLAWRYLTSNAEFLRSREHGMMNCSDWYAYTRNQALDVIALPKIFTPDLSTKAAFSLDSTGEFFFTGGVAGGYGLLVSPQYSRAYVLGLLNSRLLDWVHHMSATQMRGGWYSYESRFIRDLPLRIADMQNMADKAAHDRIVGLVDSMLALHKQLLAADSESRKEVIRRQIDATDREIDRLVYDLYGLTAEEIAIVEGSAP
ncbi:MAG TPA: Eco57I restriction-modification methylase domain-containing protein [Phycisphaerae bacterium]|nr:Eco57I restriction-modification methylase domain-containing protein [Phycisphaerae bacterium]